MPLLQIKEPSKETSTCAVGIDLGTTHSLIALHHDEKIVVLKDENNETLLPSVVRYLPDGKVCVGQAAKSAFAADPQNTILSVKRLMGRKPQDILQSNPTSSYHFEDEASNHCTLTTVAGAVDPVQVSAQILKTLLKRAHLIDSHIHEAVITVPAYFDDAQRQATKDAARLAGIKVLRLLNEPTAAALAYGLDKGTQGTCLVFDLGGGTFDVSLLQLSEGVFEVLATGGDTALGGDDIDRLLVEWIMQQMPPGPEPKLADLLILARNAKEALSNKDSISIEYEGWRKALTLATFNQLIHPLIERTLNICRKVLMDAALTRDQIQHIVLVGGMTRAPYLREQVATFFAKAPLTDIDPEKVVAMGAAIQASILSGNPTFKHALLLDVLPLSLGIEMMGGVVEKILMRNTPIPAQATQSFTTYQDGQTGISLHVVQGERELAKDCRSLAHFDLSFPPMRAGKAQVEVTFRVDCDGLLSVQAIEKLSGIKSAIEAKSTHGLSEQTIHQLIEDSIVNATEDLQLRKLHEKTIEAEQLRQSIEKALISEGHLLTRQQQEALITTQTILSHAIESNELKILVQAIKDIDEIVQDFANWRLNKALAQAFVGKTLSDVETQMP